MRFGVEFWIAAHITRRPSRPWAPDSWYLYDAASQRDFLPGSYQNIDPVADLEHHKRRGKQAEHTVWFPLSFWRATRVRDWTYFLNWWLGDALRFSKWRCLHACNVHTCCAQLLGNVAWKKKVQGMTSRQVAVDDYVSNLERPLCIDKCHQRI